MTNTNEKTANVTPEEDRRRRLRSSGMAYEQQLREAERVSLSLRGFRRKALTSQGSAS
jgi:hypothetical protein